MNHLPALKNFFRILAFSLLLFSCKKEEDLSLTRILVEGTVAYYDGNTATYTATLPTTTDFSSLQVDFETNAGEIRSGDRVLARTNTGIDLTQPLPVKVTKGKVTQEFAVAVRNTGLPVVRIETPGHQEITSKEVWMEGASIRIELPDGTVDFQGNTEIRGRGNSTWEWYPKKPYALRLESKNEILSMPSHKRWILLANWKDRTLLRNDAAFWLSRHTGLPYTARGQFVELVLNGKHKGNYYLCEQIKLNKNRVNIKQMDPMETDPVKITGGYLLELDTYYDEPYRFRYPQLFDLPWMVKEPDDDELSEVAYEYIKGWIKDLETLFKDNARVQAHEYEEYLDVDTAIDYLLVEELTGNHDFYNTWPSNGPHSTYMYKERGGKLYTGPVWDFDYHVFIPNRTQQWAGAKQTLFYPALLKDEKFRARLVERWNLQKDVLKGLPDYIDEMADKIRVSEAYNIAMWPISNDENGDEKKTFQESIDRIKKAFLDKWEWMDKNIGNLRL